MVITRRPIAALALVLSLLTASSLAAMPGDLGRSESTFETSGRLVQSGLSWLQEAWNALLTIVGADNGAIVPKP